QDNDGPSTESEIDNQERPNDENSTKDINTIGPSINTTNLNINNASPTVNTVRLSDDFFGADNDIRNHSLDNVIGDILSGIQTRRMAVTTNEQGFISAIYEERTREDLHTCLFACFLSQEEPKRITNALKDPTWVEAMQEEFLQFHLQKVWTLVDLPREEVYVCQPPRFEDPDYPDKVYKVEKALYSLHQAPRANCSFNLVAYIDSNYAGARLDKKSTSRGCQFLGCRLISWQCKKQTVVATSTTEAEYVAAASCYGQCKKQTVVATSTTEAEYVAAASCYGQVLWIQNQLLDYGLTFAGEAHHIWLSLILDKKMIKYELSNGLFVPMESKGQAADSKAGEGSSKVGKSLKRSGEEELGHEQKESSKKAKGRLKRKTSKAREDKDKRQKKQDDPEKLTLMKYVEVISDSEEVINVIPLAVKSPIVNWKSYYKGDVGHYEIHKADKSCKTYIFFSEMLNDFDREDLIVLYRLFNKKYASTRPGFDDLMLWGDMTIMFKPDDDDEV
nr:hypothetical protein [Tanacetum cinerariifolium]